MVKQAASLKNAVMTSLFQNRTAPEFVMTLIKYYILKLSYICMYAFIDYFITSAFIYVSQLPILTKRKVKKLQTFSCAV